MTEEDWGGGIFFSAASPHPHPVSPPPPGPRTKAAGGKKQGTYRGPSVDMTARTAVI